MLCFCPLPHSSPLPPLPSTPALLNTLKSFPRMDDILRETDAGYIKTREGSIVGRATGTHEERERESQSPIATAAAASASSPRSLRSPRSPYHRGSSPRSYSGGGGGGGRDDFTHSLSYSLRSERDQDNESTHSGFAFAHVEGRRTWTSEREKRE